MNRDWSRREFLKTASAATLSALLAGAPRGVFGAERAAMARADSVIFLWLPGGVAHVETFDPKTHTPFVRGMGDHSLQSTFKTIDSVVDTIKLSAGLEHLAKVMDRATLLKSLVPPNLGHILHARHQFHWHTGYAPPTPVAVPHFGSMIGHFIGSKNKILPPVIHIGQRLDIPGAAELKPFLSAGFLGAEFSPMIIPDAADAVRTVAPPEHITPSRFANRQAFFKKLLASTPTGEFGSDYQRDSLTRAFDRGFELMSSDTVQAFDLRLEKKEVFDRYNTGRFGLGCLLARRLVEAGARFVEVSSEFVPFGNWDTHDKGHIRTVTYKKWIDFPIMQLVLDLEERGLLDRTLVVVASEFSRSCFKVIPGIKPDLSKIGAGQRMINANQYGLHYHFTGACPVLFFGGGMKRGFSYGQTSNEIPFEVVKDAVEMHDVHATIFSAMGISPDSSVEYERRPFYVTPEGKGVPIAPLFA